MGMGMGIGIDIYLASASRMYTHSTHTTRLWPGGTGALSFPPSLSRFSSVPLPPTLPLPPSLPPSLSFSLSLPLPPSLALILSLSLSLPPAHRVAVDGGEHSPLLPLSHPLSLTHTVLPLTAANMCPPWLNRHSLHVFTANSLNGLPTPRSQTDSFYPLSRASN